GSPDVMHAGTWNCPADSGSYGDTPRASSAYSATWIPRYRDISLVPSPSISSLSFKATLNTSRVRSAIDTPISTPSSVRHVLIGMVLPPPMKVSIDWVSETVTPSSSWFSMPDLASIFQLPVGGSPGAGNSSPRGARYISNGPTRISSLAIYPSPSVVPSAEGGSWTVTRFPHCRTAWFATAAGTSTASPRG